MKRLIISSLIALPLALCTLSASAASSLHCPSSSAVKNGGIMLTIYSAQMNGYAGAQLGQFGTSSNWTVVVGPLSGNNKAEAIRALKNASTPTVYTQEGTSVCMYSMQRPYIIAVPNTGS